MSDARSRPIHLDANRQSASVAPTSSHSAVLFNRTPVPIMKATAQCILVQGPRWGDALFYGEWLLAAAKAETFWKHALKDPHFKKQVEPVHVCYIPDFGIAATAMIVRLSDHSTSFLLDMNREGIDEFVMMAGMGLFAQHEQRYRMAVPTEMTAEEVRTSIPSYAKTQDDQFELHPEYLVTGMPYSRALGLQARLHAIDEFNTEVSCLGRA
jgi:hypothetical protein